MWSNSTLLCLLFLLVSSYTGLKASHILGGEINYSFVAYNADETIADIKVTLTLYRDPQGIPYDLMANFGVFVEEPWGAWRSYTVVENVPISPIEEVTTQVDPCKTRFLTDARMQRAQYSFIVSLEVGEADYTISYQKCCRAFNISNIVGTGGDLGSVYDILITSEALKVGNSSPAFTDTPPIFICAGFPQAIDQSVTDVDNDEVTYNFCAPLFTGPPGTSCGGATQNPDPMTCPPPYPGLTFLPQFSIDRPMGGSPTISINQSGIMTGTPDLIGSYVVGVCIEERRNGVLMSRTRRDYEFNVVECSENLVANIEASQYITDTLVSPDPIAYFESCNPKIIDFINQSEDENFIQDYLWEIDDPQGNTYYTQQGIDNKDVQVYFEDPGQYQGKMILNDGATCFDTAFFIVYIVPKVEILTSCTYDTCLAGPVDFLNLTEAEHSDLSWFWTFGEGGNSTETSPQYLYANRDAYTIDIVVTDTFGCTNTQSKILDWQPFALLPPDTIQIDTLLCAEDSIRINDRWISNSGTFLEFIPSSYTGCDSIVQEISVQFREIISSPIVQVSICEEETYDFFGTQLSTAGLYTETLTSRDGCDSIVTLELSLLEINRTQDTKSICPDETIVFGERILCKPGIYVDTFTNASGCDSIVALRLELISEKFTNVIAEMCDTEVYIINGDTLTVGGIYDYDLVAASNCDSTVTLTLIVNPSYDQKVTEEICEGGIFNFGNDELSEAGTYSYSGSTTLGCDSLVVLELSVLSDSEYAFIDTICQGETYPFGSVDLTLPGIYFDTLTNDNGCDSIIILELEVGRNLTRINVNEELEEEFGETIILKPNIQGGDLIVSEWYEADQFISEELILNYTVTDDNWIYFESTNELFCVAIDSVFIRSRIDIDIYFPNMITPNGDGLNDFFNIGASPTLKTSQMNIYDRWGNLIYVGPTTEDRQITAGWDGTRAGTPVEIGTYAYLVRVEFINGDKEVYAGEIQVLR